jgi:hypothetical protein
LNIQFLPEDLMDKKYFVLKALKRNSQYEKDKSGENTLAGLPGGRADSFISKSPILVGDTEKGPSVPLDFNHRRNISMDKQGLPSTEIKSIFPRTTY